MQRRAQRLEICERHEPDADASRRASVQPATQRGQAERGEHRHAEQEQVAESRRGSQALHRRKDVIEPAVDRRARAERQHDAGHGNRDEHDDAAARQAVLKFLWQSAFSPARATIAQ